MKKDIGRVFVSNLIKMVTTIIVTFIVPNFLSIDGYANIKLFQLYVSYVGVFHFGFCDGIFLSYGEKKLDDCNRKKMAIERNSLIFYQVVITFLLVVLSKNFIQFFCVLNCLPATCFTYYTYIYQATGEFKRYAHIMITNSVLNLLANIILILTTKDYKIYICVYTIVAYIIFLYAFFNIKMEKNGVSINVLWKNMKLGFLLMLGNLAYTFFLSIDKLFVKFTLGMEYFAYYSFAVQLLTVINMFMTPVALTMYSHFCKNKSKEFEIKVKSIIIRVLCCMLYITFIFRWIINNYMESYIKSIDVLVLLMAAQIFLSFNIVIYVNLFKVYKKKREYIKNLIAVIVISILLNYAVYMINATMTLYALATLISMLIWTKMNEKYFKYLAFDKKEKVMIIVVLAVYIIIS